MRHILTNPDEIDEQHLHELQFEENSILAPQKTVVFCDKCGQDTENAGGHSFDPENLESTCFDCLEKLNSNLE